MIIAISGKIGSGKDTVGNIIRFLTAKYGNDYLHNDLEVVKMGYTAFFKNPINPKGKYVSDWQVKKFADALKEICSILTGIPREDFEKQEVKDSFLGDEWTKKSSNWIKKEALELDATQSKMSVDSFIDYQKKRGMLEQYGAEGTNVEPVYRLTYLDEKRTIRWLLQTVGTEAMRNHVHENVWVNALFAHYKTHKLVFLTKEETGIIPAGELDAQNWIITDMRFPNELKAVKDHGGITIRINREQQWFTDFKHCPTKGIDIMVDEDGNSVVYRDVTYDHHGRYDTKDGREIIEEVTTHWSLTASKHPSETSLDDAKFDYTIDNNGTIEELVEKVKEILIKEKII